jgi:DMSO/TMAO reductase YedYZ molybdopterin-dependent catalytic subunit
MIPTLDTPEIDQSAARAATPPHRWMSVVAGLVAGGVAVVVAVLVAGLLRVVSPIDAVGGWFVDRTPPWLKDWAIEQFGTNNKSVLETGIYVVLAGAAAMVGWLTVRTRVAALAGFSVFSALGAATAVSRAGATWSAALPPLLGALVGAPLLIRLVHQRPAVIDTPGPSRVPLEWDRRRFVAGTVGAAGAAAIIGVAGRAVERSRVSDARAQIPDSLPPVTPRSDSAGATPVPANTAPPLEDVNPFVTPTADFYRIDTALSFPRVNLDKWQLTIDGMVDRPISLSYDDLLAMPQIERTITLCCVSNEIGGPYIGNATWRGVLLGDVLVEAGVKDGAEQVFSTSLDGWTCGFPTEVALDGRDCMIAIGMNGQALTLQHGFPARLVVPGLYGYVSATKWLRRITLTTWDDAEGYWVPRGWSRLAPIKTQSRIDVPRRRDRLAAGPVAIAGVAWAQHRGISRVEVRVDDGEWRDANLAEELSVDTWRQWWIEWDATDGDHVIQVRATDGTGQRQPEEVTPVAPDGATGWHTRRVAVG